MTAVTSRVTSSHDKSETYDSDASQEMPTSYNKSKPHNRPSLPQEESVSNEHSTFPKIPVSHDTTTYMDHLPLHRKNQHYVYNSSDEYENKDDAGKTGYAWPHANPGRSKKVMKMRCNLL